MKGFFTLCDLTLVLGIYPQIKKLSPASTTKLYEVKDDQFTVQSTFGSLNTSIKYATRCDMETDGGGWMVIQRRIAGGTVNFTRDWNDYVNGFGDLNGEFWYGLDNIHYLTTRDDVELRIDMVNENNGSELSWTYQTFTVAGADDKYRLTIGGGVGTEGFDSMKNYNDNQFSTYDSDNDKLNTNCANIYQGGWWYNGCGPANLNGPHAVPNETQQLFAKMIWYCYSFLNIRSSEMKIRRKQCQL